MLTPIVCKNRSNLPSSRDACSAQQAIGGLLSAGAHNADAAAAVAQQAQDAAAQLAAALCNESVLDAGEAGAAVLLQVQRLLAAELDEPYMVRQRGVRQSAHCCLLCLHNFLNRVHV